MASPALDLTQALNQALAAYRAGQLAQAEQICQQIVSIERKFFDAHYVLAVVQAGLGKNDQALTNYDHALALQPHHAEALSNRGNSLKALKRFDEALNSYDRALAVQPDYPTALSNRGTVLFEMKRYEEALATFDRSLAIRPDQALALYNRGGTLHKLERFEEAVASYDCAVALNPQFAEAYANRGNTLLSLGRYGDALASFDRALALRPDLVEALTNRGNALNGLKRLDEALASYDRAIAIQPTHAGAHYNRGTTLHEMNRYDEALASYDRAIAMQVDYPEAHSNRGATLWELKRHDEALASYDRAIALQPKFPEAHWNAASLRLLTGDFDRGWEEYEWRWQHKTMALARRDFAQPLWRGEPIEGKTILLYSEQGLGDAIQFCRYVPLVAARGAKVILEVDKRLQELMTGLAGTGRVLSAGDVLPEFDLHCPLLSLPRAFHTRVETIPSITPYLQAPAQKLMKWKSRLEAIRGFRVGLIWSGNPAHHRDLVRSIDLNSSAAITGYGSDICQPAEGHPRCRCHHARGTRGYRSYRRRTRRLFRHRSRNGATRSRYFGRYQHRPSCRRAGAPGLDLVTLLTRLAVVARSRNQPLVSDGPIVSPGRNAPLGQRNPARPGCIAGIYCQRETQRPRRVIPPGPLTQCF